MALDPNIPLQVRSPNLMQALMSGYAAGQAIRQAPLMQQILEQRATAGQQGIQAETQRQNLLRTQSERTGTQFEQEQAIQKARYANRLARELKGVPFENRQEIIQQNAGTLQQLGIDPGQLDPTDENLDNTISGTDPFVRQNVESERVQSATNLPGGITKMVLRDGSIVVKDASGGILSGDEAVSVVREAERREAELAGFKSQLMQEGKESTEGGKLSIEKAKFEMDKRIKGAQKSVIGTQSDVDAALVALDDLSEGGYRKIYGKADSRLPDLFRSQDALDAMALRDQVIGLVSLESREKLKGQGTITDSEAKTLEKSATILANPSISDKLALREIRRVRNIFRGKKIHRQEDTTNNDPLGIR